ncbi:response regulator transcription factor [Aeromonas simiae]|uniref:response regulator transcription factor n=1 Tax=Aeromonas simiae TaxID=218936 RepID=UPI0005A60D9F|nr:response regulator transcription factor [Aeromonas simiae]
MEGETNILVVDDHPAVRMAIRIILAKQGYKNIDQASNGQDALLKIRQKHYDLVILDIDLPMVDGLAITKKIRAQNLKTKILMLSAMVTDFYILRCYMAGANGFMEKSEEIEGLPVIVGNIMKGFSYFPTMANGQVDPQAMDDEHEWVTKTLSDREMTVFNGLVKGRSNLEIANELFLSNKTISTYKTRIFTKLGVSNIAELIEIAQSMKQS